MTDLKTELINEVIKTEGGYVFDPSDSGGETKYGITRAVATRYGYTQSMLEMPKQVAFDIYAARYWDKLHCDQIASLSKKVAAEVFDTGVNMGTGRAGKFLQRSLNVMNNRGHYYPDIRVDGAIGNQTIRALSAYIKRRGDKVLYRALNSLQGAFYITLAERREKDERFVYGWFSNRVD